MVGTFHMLHGFADHISHVRTFSCRPMGHVPSVDCMTCACINAELLVLARNSSGGVSTFPAPVTQYYKYAMRLTHVAS
jgi:hypothetical protein